MTNGNQFTEKQLGFSYWYVTHKILLKNISISILLVLIFTLAAYNIYFLIFNLVIYQKEYQAGLSSLVATSPESLAFRQANLPQAIQTVQIKTLPNVKGFDIIAEIANPNPKWWATFDYQFQIGQNLTAIQKEFILPGERKKIVALAVENGNLVSQIVFSNIKWQKEINFASLFNDRYKLEIKNINYIPAKELGIGEKTAISRLTFDVTNGSAYNYSNVNFLIFLNSGGQWSAVNQLASGKFLSGETKNLAVTFFQSLPKITDTEITAEVNILDNTVFLKF